MDPEEVEFVYCIFTEIIRRLEKDGLLVVRSCEVCFSKRLRENLYDVLNGSEDNLVDNQLPGVQPGDCILCVKRSSADVCSVGSPTGSMENREDLNISGSPSSYMDREELNASGSPNSCDREELNVSGSPNSCDREELNVSGSPNSCDRDELNVSSSPNSCDRDELNVSGSPNSSMKNRRGLNTSCSPPGGDRTDRELESHVSPANNGRNREEERISESRSSFLFSSAEGTGVSTSSRGSCSDHQFYEDDEVGNSVQKLLNFSSDSDDDLHSQPPGGADTSIDLRSGSSQNNVTENGDSGQQRDSATDTDDDDDQFEAFLLSTRKDIEARSAKRNKTTLSLESFIVSDSDTSIGMIPDNDVPQGGPVIHDVSQGGPGVSDVPQGGPVIHDVPQGGPGVSDVPQGGPGVSDVPQGGPGVSDVPQGGPGVSDVPQGGPGVSDVPQGGPGVSDVPQGGPGVSDVPQGGPVIHDVPQGGPGVSDVPQGGPGVSDVPQGGPGVSDVPQGGPGVSDVPQGGPVIHDVPQGGPGVSDVPQGGPGVSDVPQGGPGVSDVPQGGPVIHDVPQGSTGVDIVLRGNPGVSDVPQGGPDTCRSSPTAIYIDLTSPGGDGREEELEAGMEKLTIVENSSGEDPEVQTSSFDTGYHEQYHLFVESVRNDKKTTVPKGKRKSIQAFILSNECGEILEEELDGEGDNEVMIYDERGPEASHAPVSIRNDHPPSPPSIQSIFATPRTSQRPFTETPHPSSTVTKQQRERVAKEAFVEFNSRVFANKLPSDTAITWNNRMTKTAGICKYQSSNAVSIDLSTKVCDSVDRIRATLLHEMCHAAVWLVDRKRDGHGPYWRAWANRAHTVYPNIEVSRCHTFDIKAKFLYKCTKCDYSTQRHSKSVNVTKSVCPYCFSSLTLHKGDGTPYVPRKPNSFASFVKENYGRLKQELPNTPHSEIMRQLSVNFKRCKE